MANEAATKAANEVATRTLVNKQSSIEDDVNIDKEMKRLFYKKMTRPSLADTLSEQIDSNLAGHVVQKLMPALFGSGETAVASESSKGFMGAILQILNTQFAYGAGQAAGNRIPEIIQSIGKDKITAIMDAYNQQINPAYQQMAGNASVNPEEQMIYEQQEIEKHKKQSQNRNDINRQLIDQYESDQNTSASGNRSFFDGSSELQPLSNISQSNINMTEDEFILSLNSDDPISIHQYMSHKGIVGVDNDTVKKMLIKDQKKYLGGLNNKEFNINHGSGNVSSQLNLLFDEDIGKTMKKDEFYKEININPENISGADKHIDKSHQIQQSNNDINNIMMLLEKIGSNVEVSIQSLNKKIEELENEISVIKSTSIDSTNVTDVISTDLMIISNTQKCDEVIEIESQIKEKEDDHESADKDSDESKNKDRGVEDNSQSMDNRDKDEIDEHKKENNSYIDNILENKVESTEQSDNTENAKDENAKDENAKDENAKDENAKDENAKDENAKDEKYPLVSNSQKSKFMLKRGK